jgi:hypothetical protein
LALPAFAGNSPPEIALPHAPEEVIESASRTDVAGQHLPEEIIDDPTAKEHNDQCDEPDGPPCEEGG